MAFVSTRNPRRPQRYSLAEALKLGPAPDGGLFLPARLEPLPASFFASLLLRRQTNTACTTSPRRCWNGCWGRI